jgi:hypothetical protein
MFTLHQRRIELGTLTVAAILLLPACSVNVKKNEHGDDQKVDINTPFGGVHVDKAADARDTGLAIYPGARLKEKEGNDEKNANVNISSSFGGIRVVALEYESDDAPDKVVSFYRNQLKKFGNVLQCHTHKHGRDVEIKASSGDHAGSLKCEDDDGGTLELKVGEKDNQRIVAIEPVGNGTRFTLVRVEIHGKESI